MAAYDYQAVDKKGKIIEEKVIARQEGDFPVIESKEVHYTDVAPNQISSISFSEIDSIPALFEAWR